MIRYLVKTSMLFVLLLTACEEDIREVELFDKGEIVAFASSTNIESGETVTFTEESTKVQTLKWSFPNGDPFESEASMVDVTFTNPSSEDALTVNVVLSVTFVDNTSSEQSIPITIAPAEAAGGGTPLPPLDIAFVTDDLAGDQGYIDLLVSKGHTVEAEAGKYNNLDNAGASTLNGFDLVIISRATNSGNFSDGARPAWTSVTTPVLNLSSYVARSTRLQYFNSPNQNEAGGTSIKAIDAAHPVFTGITLDADGAVAVTDADLHVIESADPGNGTLIGTTADGSKATIAIFEAGASYDGGEAFAGKRMFLAGTGGGFTYNNSGAQLFLNCVEFLVTGAVFDNSLPFRKLDIAFVTDDVAGDQGYIDLLVSKGHTVEAEAGKYNNLDNAGASTLNGFDLVIISRSTNSGNFSDGARPAWTSVTAPVLNLSSYVARSTRLQYFNSANQNEAGGTSIKAVDTAHPVFTGITLDADGTVAVTDADLHVIESADPGNGTLIGLTADGSKATIALFEAGASYDGGEAFAGKRMFLAGTGGGFTYNDKGAQLFLNCVDYTAN